MIIKTLTDLSNIPEWAIEHFKLSGNHIECYLDGHKMWESNYLNGEPHGKQIGWYIGGRKKCEYNLINGKMHGKQSSGDCESNYEHGVEIKNKCEEEDV